MLNQIITLLSAMLGAEEGELEPDLDLFESGLLDSFAVVQLIVELEEKLGVKLAIETLAREDIATPALIAKLAEAQK
jgi:D-alanine--poly(phosphoribitol) ligase subunit 2